MNLANRAVSSSEKLHALKLVAGFPWDRESITAVHAGLLATARKFQVFRVWLLPPQIAVEQAEK